MGEANRFPPFGWDPFEMKRVSLGFPHAEKVRENPRAKDVGQFRRRVRQIPAFPRAQSFKQALSLLTATVR